MNQVAAHAYELLGLEACYVMNVASQHLGVNILGRTWTDSASICRGSPIALEEDGSVQQVPGFDVAGFMEASKQSCYKVFWFAHHDKPNQHIIDRQPVHPCFDRLK